MSDALLIPDNVVFIPEALDDLAGLDGSVKKRVMAAIIKVSRNPVSKGEGGYGKPLGNKRTNNLTGYLEIKLRDDGVRCIYRCEQIMDMRGMRVIVISMRKDEKVYGEAMRRIEELSINE